jgi:uncharacterized protein DUF4386
VEWFVEASPGLKARIAGVFYLLTFVTGALALSLTTGRDVANLAATVCYVAVAVLFFDLFRPVDKNISLLALFFGLLGCAFGALTSFHFIANVNPLVFFGVYCLLIGYLIVKSTFLPTILGVLMAIGGLGWLTFLSPAFASSLAPYNLIPGMFGEGCLTLWLLAMGVNVPRWKTQAGATT